MFKDEKGAKNVLAIHSLSKVYTDKIAVNNLELAVKGGEVLGFLGPNGSGKTTTFRMVLGIIPPTSGTILWHNKMMQRLPKKTIGYLPEERGLFAHISVREQIQLFARLKGMPKRKVDTAMHYWAERLKFTEYLDKKVSELSKGNQQKIQLAIAIIHEPSLLILDEPFSGLDPLNVELLKSVVHEMKQKGTTILFSSHRMDHVEELCEKICILKQGKPILSGYIDDIKKNFGQNKLVIEGNEDFSSLQGMKEIQDFKYTKHGVTFMIKSPTVAQTIFSRLKEFSAITKFSLEEPSLNDIFLAKVGHHDE
ncbi:ATP-binding cassette domain-containing protein [Lysinibacillus sp. G4S2]|uniref:ABC transporter ATP-binding protein n=1 Tax=Lysinibacillus sp. G4S2 TaxID=3055859 RepID=UPI0025A177B4|nr:ATP-binding cassette domain-containing protein [Lysinibacillus sp. G4S2]MDM5247610.1 ATP-binding cassette domain-containing protein [Lysinibacillus sp. G4S2]